MSEAFFVDTDVLRAHADTVDAIRSTVDLAVDAGREVTPLLWDNAYGVMCQNFPVLTKQLALTQVGGVWLLAKVMGGTAQDIRDTAAVYDAFEHDIADKLEALIELLGPR